MSAISRTLKEWLIGVVVALSVGVLLWWVNGVIVDNVRQACRSYSERTLRDTELVKMAPLDWQCFVRVDGHWVPQSEIRTVKEVTP